MPVFTELEKLREPISEEDLKKLEEMNPLRDHLSLVPEEIT